MQSIIQFSVSKQDDAFTAEGVNVPIVTEAPTLDALAANIREAVGLLFENEDPAMFGFTSPLSRRGHACSSSGPW